MSSEPLSSSSNGIIADALIGNTSSDVCEPFPERALTSPFAAGPAGDFERDAAGLPAGLADDFDACGFGAAGRGDENVGEPFSAA